MRSLAPDGLLLLENADIVYLHGGREAFLVDTLRAAPVTAPGED